MNQAELVNAIVELHRTVTYMAEHLAGYFNIYENAEVTKLLQSVQDHLLEVLELDK